MHKKVCLLTAIVLKLPIIHRLILTFCAECDILATSFRGFEPKEEMNVEESYGKKFGEAKTLPLAVSGMLMVAFIFLVAGISVLGYGISKGTFASLGVTGIVLLLVGVLLLIYCIKTIMGRVICYENAIVIKETFKTTVIPREKIAAIFWERPGANASNEKVRTNVNVADIILVGGRQHYKISDGYYSNVEVLGLYQNEYKIPMEIKR